MKVAVYDYVEGLEMFRCTDNLDQVLPDLGERNRAHAYLMLSGRYWLGGGAGPLTLLMLAADEPPCEKTR